MTREYFSLHRKEKVTWVVTNGEATLYAIEKRANKAEGPRHLIGTYYENDSLYSFPIRDDLPFEIVLELSPGAKVKEEVYEPSEEIETHQTDFLEEIKARLEREKREEQERLKKRKEKERESLSQKLKRLASVIEPVKEEGEELRGVAAVLKLIGKRQKITITIPDELPKDDIEDQIESICAASHIRLRRVKLEKDFWKRDSGPLLVFYGPEKKAVALLQDGWGCYQMIDPEKRTEKKVTEEVAKELSSLSFMFYRPFGDSLKTPKEVLSFYMQTSYKRFVPMILYSSFAALISLFPPIATKYVFAAAVPDANISLLMQISIGLIIAAVSAALFFFFQSLVLVRIEGYGSYELQSALWDRLLKLPVSFFRHFSAGNLLYRVNALEQMRTLLSDKTVRALITGIFSCFYIVAMMVYSPKLTVVALIVMVSTIVISLVCLHAASKIQHKVLDLQGTLNGFLIQIISGIAKLRVSGAEINAFSKWADLFSDYKRGELKTQNIKNIVYTISSMMPLFSFAIIFTLAINLRVKGDLSLSDFLAFNAAYLVFSAAIYSFSEVLLELVPIRPLWGRVKVILNETVEDAEVKESEVELKGEIHIDDLCFRYEKESPLVLDNITIHIKPGEFIGIVGPSGCGKSTLVRQLLRFEKPLSGAIYYDGRDAEHLNIHKLRQQMGVVLQHGGIVSGSIYDNIVCGGRYDPEQITNALKLSGFEKDLEEMPMGFHTILPMGGETLSGGQKQRLIIARALLSNPKILIFDEATSALDNKTQQEISNNIDELKVTRIVIAHRLSTIKKADRIYLMEKGKIIDQGTFEGLAKSSELFAHMLHRQKL